MMEQAPAARGGPRLVTPPATPRVTVAFTADRAMHDPGGSLRASYRVEAVDPATITTIERSVAWYTEGKGEEDLGVVFFERLTADRADTPADASPERPAADWPNGHLAAQLPLSPLSYEGLIVKIRWCVRVRLFFVGGRDFVSEHIFFVGKVPVARPLKLAVS